MQAQGFATVINESWGRGAEGGVALAEATLAEIGRKRSAFRPLYPDDMPLLDKIGVIAREIYRAAEVVADAGVAARLKHWEDGGLRPPADLRGQDAIFVLRPTRPRSARRAASPCRCATSGCAPAPASSSR